MNISIQPVQTLVQLNKLNYTQSESLAEPAGLSDHFAAAVKNMDAQNQASQQQIDNSITELADSPSHTVALSVLYESGENSKKLSIISGLTGRLIKGVESVVKQQ